MIEPVRVIGGHVVMPERMLRYLLDQREAERRWAERMENDPEYAAEWLRGQAEREDD